MWIRNYMMWATDTSMAPHGIWSNLSALLHSFNRSIDVIAADTHRKVCDEENRKYDRLEDERERAWSAAR